MIQYWIALMLEEHDRVFLRKETGENFLEDVALVPVVLQVPHPAEVALAQRHRQ
jgi:hypothetical protein